MPKKQVLGRGLDILIPQGDMGDFDSSRFFYCDIDAIRPNPYQPRRAFPQQDLENLASSITEKGVLQPLVVRAGATGYELIVGERRWRASRMAGLKQVPVIVKDVTPAEMLELALIENIQREDLNPLEKADAYHRLMEEFNLTQESVAKRVGQDRSTVANFLRLRGLPKEIRDDIAGNKLSMGHARAILGAKTPLEQKAVWRRIISENLSVRAVESLIKRLRAEKEKTPRPKGSSSEAVYFQSLEDDLSRVFGTKVRIVRRGKRGRVEIAFYNDADLDRLITRLKNFS
jgi:ParB family chromosome partitioning protein